MPVLRALLGHQLGVGPGLGSSLKRMGCLSLHIVKRYVNDFPSNCAPVIQWSETLLRELLQCEAHSPGCQRFL